MYLSVFSVLPYNIYIHSPRFNKNNRLLPDDPQTELLMPNSMSSAFRWRTTMWWLLQINTISVLAYRNPWHSNEPGLPFKKALPKHVERIIIFQEVQCQCSSLSSWRRHGILISSTNFGISCRSMHNLDGFAWFWFRLDPGAGVNGMHPQPLNAPSSLCFSDFVLR